MNRKYEDDEFPIMRGERRVRFACGVVAGVFAGCQLAPRFAARGAGEVFLVVATALAFGIAAALLGDRFWRGFQ